MYVQDKYCLSKAVCHVKLTDCKHVQHFTAAAEGLTAGQVNGKHQLHL